MWLYEELTEVEGYLLCPDCIQSNTIICRSCGTRAINNRPLVPKRIIEGLCETCEMRIHYERATVKLVSEVMDSKSSSINLPYRQLKNESHYEIINRLAKCRKPYASAILIEFSMTTLVMVHEKQIDFVEKYLRRNYLESYSMTEFKTKRPYQWEKFDKESGSKCFTIHEKNTFHLWDNPLQIRAVTDRVSDYRKEWRFGVLEYEGNNFGDHEMFYIIGSIHNI